MSTTVKIALGAVALLAAFAFGRWAAPEKTKIVKEIVTVKEKQKVKVVEKDVHRTTTITEYPGGRKETVIVDNSTVSSDTKTDTKKDQTSKTETEISRGTSKVTVSALAGVKLNPGGDPTHQPILYGASVSKPILGPITVGAWGLSDKHYGMSLGLTL